MNNILGFFTSIYQDKKLLLQKKALYTTIFSFLLILLIFVSYTITLVTEGFYWSILIEVIIILALFLTSFYFIKKGQLEKSINILLLAGFIRSATLLPDNIVGQFYSTSMLVILTTAVVHMKRYQMIIISVFFPIIYVLKLYLLRLEFTKGLIPIIQFNQNLYVVFILLVYLSMVYFLVNIIDNEIKESEELATSKQQINIYLEELEELNKKLKKLASTDKLTGVLNRRKFEEIVDVEIEKCKRYDFIIALILFDIDHFKKINDKFGHKVGDYVLIEISKLISSNIRKSDYLIRWGGEEFIILACGLGTKEGVELAEKLRKAIEQHSFMEVGNITVSFGVTEYNKSENIDAMIIRADKALYRAKETGRNKVEYSFPPAS